MVIVGIVLILTAALGFMAMWLSLGDDGLNADFRRGFEAGYARRDPSDEAGA